MVQLVVVVNNYDIYNTTIGKNPFMVNIPVQIYDNTVHNVGISKRYNDFLDNLMRDDTWIIFCHQDFGFQQEITGILDSLDKNIIYGPIGTAPTRQLVFAAALSCYGLERLRLGFYNRRKEFGQILQETARKKVKMGHRIRKPVIVDTVDCCCMIIHSSLVRSFVLRFDEKLDWHLYVEDFCLNAKFNHSVLTKAVQFDCVHRSDGNLNYNFIDDLAYLKRKYKTEAFSTTCYDGYQRF